MPRNRNKILFAVTIAPTIRILMDGQIEWLASKGYEVHTCSSGELGVSRDGRSFFHRHHTIGMTRKISPLRDLLSWLQWFAVIARVRPYTLVASTPKAALISLVAGFVMRVPRRVYLLRGLRLETVTGWRRNLLTLVERVCARCAHLVIAVSPSVGREFVALNLAPQGKVIHIGHGSSNGVNAKWFSPVSESDRTNLRSQFGFTADEIIVAYVGRLVIDKGWTVFVKTAKEVTDNNPRIRVVAIGSNEGGVEIPAWISHVDVTDDIRSWYRVMDVLILPTFREGFPNVPLEAAACGVPTIATRATGAVDSVVDGITGLLVPVGDAKGLASAIEHLASDTDLCKQLGKQARRWVETEFKPEQIWQGYLDAYDSITVKS